jgi:hypothetical protein
MNLYLISQTTSTGYDTYDSAVVAATSTEAARKIHPQEYVEWRNKAWRWKETGELYDSYSWAQPKAVSVTLIGIATENVKSGVICASFNAG